MRADDWQPIETAPKDGTRVRLWLPNPQATEVHGMWWRGWNGRNPEIWRVDGGIPLERSPTHWQPIVGPVLATVPADTKPADDRPHCPYTLVPMPVNAEGRGPEMDPAKVVRTDWEVWDELNRCVAVIRETEGV